MSKRKSKKSKPTPLKTWYIAVAAFFFIGGLGNVGSSMGAALLGLGVAGIMLFFTVQTIKKRNRPEPSAEIYVIPSQPSQQAQLFNPVKGKLRYSAKNYIAFDVETTGLSSENNRIIEIAAIKVIEDSITEKFSTFVNPGCVVPANITKLTGITNSDLAAAPQFKDIAEGLINFFGELPIVAHNASFDSRFLKSELNRAGYTFEFKYIDTLSCARKAYPEMKNHKLETLSEALCLSEHKQSHRALDDAEMCHKLYQRCKEKLNS